MIDSRPALGYTDKTKRPQKRRFFMLYDILFTLDPEGRIQSVAWGGGGTEELGRRPASGQRRLPPSGGGGRRKAGLGGKRL